MHDFYKYRHTPVEAGSRTIPRGRVRSLRAGLAAWPSNWAQGLWRDSARVEIPARTVDEPRWLMIGMLDGKHWSAVITYRAERTRIISVRRSRDEEVALYEG